MNEAGSGGQPNPEFGLEVVSNSGERSPEQSVEKAPTPQESTGNKPASPPSDAPALPPIAPLAQPPFGASDQPVTTPPPLFVITAKLSAADGNLIEKEWVEAAKTVAAKTQADPFTQKNEMSKVKADYIQKRFNKTIKTDDAVAA